jgi:hydroxyacylglutathione hydrolase
MLCRRATHDDPGCASYLTGDDDAGVAAVVGPRCEIDVDPDLARYMGVRVEHTLERSKCDEQHIPGHRTEH